MAEEFTLKKDSRKQVEDRNQNIRKMYKNESLVNGCLLHYDTAFGINSNPISNQVQVVGEKYSVFIIGNIIVVRDLLEKTEKFITKENRFGYVTALYSIYKDKHKDTQQSPLIIFLGESSENEDRNANIVLYKAYKEQLRVMNTGIKGVIKQLTVNEEKTFVAALMQSAQHLYISLWNYQKERLVTNTLLKHPVEKISIHPLKPKQILLIGKNYLRLWELQSQQNILKESQQQLVPLKTEKENRFHDFTWITTPKSATLLVLIGGNKVLVLYNDALVQTLVLEEKNQLFSIATTKKGFVVGGAAKTLSVYDMDKNFNVNNTLSISNKNQAYANEEKIIKIYVSSNDGIMTLATCNQVGSFNFYALNSFRLDAEVSSIEQFFSAGFHNKKINQMSVAVTKQLLASCSEDNTVKIWNFFEHEGYEKKGILTQSFQQEPLSVSLHPCGLFVAVGFSSGFKIFAIVNDSLVVLKEAQIPNCRFIKYSHGGHFLLVNQKEHIFVYDSIYYQTLHLFSLTSNVKEVAISYDDLYIVATCTNGYVFCFSLYESHKMRDSYQNKKGFEHKQSTVYTCIGYDRLGGDKPGENDLFIGCSIEKYMCLYRNNCKELVAQFPIVDCHVTSLCICRSLGVIFLGTNKGSVRVTLWPLDQSNLQWELSGNNAVRFKAPEFLEINAHSSAITAIELSDDDSFLFTGSEDGTILCFKIQEKGEPDNSREKQSVIKSEDRKRIAQSANDLYLERIEKIEEKNEVIRKLKFQVVRSEQKLKLEKEKLDIMCKQKLDSLEKEFKIALDTDKRIKESYIHNSEKEYQELAKRLEHERDKNAKQLQKLQQENQAKITYQEKRNKDLEEDIKNLHERHKAELISLKQEHEKQVKNNRRDFFEKCQALQIKYSNFVDRSKKHSKQFIERLENQEKTYQTEIEQQIRQKKDQIARIRAVNDELEEKNRKLTEQYNRLKEADEKQQNRFEELFKIHNNIRFQNLKNDEDILKMQHQLLQRLQVIDSKQETCKNARYEQTTLENFRYMLDSKIESLQGKKKQMMDKIAARQSDLKNMFNELIRESEDNEKKYFQLKQLNAQIAVLENELKKAEGDILNNNGRLKNFQNQLSNIIKSNDDVKIVSRKLHGLLDDEKQQIPQPAAHSQDKSAPTGDAQNELVYEQLSRQAKWMNKKLALIKSTAQNYKEIREDNINTILNQNTKLIEECNKLRGANENFKHEIKKYEKELSQFMRKKEKAESKRKLQNVNLAGLNKKLQENEIRISHQHNKLESINEEMKEILAKKEKRKEQSKKKEGSPI